MKDDEKKVNKKVEQIYHIKKNIKLSWNIFMVSYNSIIIHIMEYINLLYKEKGNTSKKEIFKFQILYFTFTYYSIYCTSDFE